VGEIELRGETNHCTWHDSLRSGTSMARRHLWYTWMMKLPAGSAHKVIRWDERRIISYPSLAHTHRA
jgi:hypothetical protein